MRTSFAFPLAFAALSGWSSSFVAAAVVSYDFHVTEFNASWDGVSRPVIGINGRPAHEFPIEVTLGDTIEVTVTNDLNAGTSLHWHGIPQATSPDQDGSSGVTQCMIAPGASAHYRFTPAHAGTYWWHGHDKSQYVYGLHAPLIVHDAPENLTAIEKTVDHDLNVMLNDWYHEDGSYIWNSVLINHRGRFNCSAIVDGAHPCSDDQPLSRFKFKRGDTYRIRLFNVGAFATYHFSIDNHQFRVISADGRPLETSDLLNSIHIKVGQRYDLIVEAKPVGVDSSVNLFWMRATSPHGLPWSFFTDAMLAPGFNPNGLAIVEYTSDKTACYDGPTEDNSNTSGEPTTSDWESIVTVDDYAFVNLNPTELPAEAEQSVSVQFKMVVTATGPFGFVSVNQGELISYEMPMEPVLYRIANGETTDQMPNTSIATALEYGKHTEILLINPDVENHPFHLHGHHPWVVASGHMADVTSTPDASTYNLKNAMLRDVYNVPACNRDASGVCLDVGYVVLRFNTDNAGVWMLHCHNEWHRSLGMSMLFVEGEHEIQEKGLGIYSASMQQTCASMS